MRTSLAFVVLVLSAIVAASTSDQGSLEALLSRISSQNSKALPVNAIPDDLKSSSTSVSVPIVSDKKTFAEPASHNPKNGKERMTKRYKQFRDGRRWIWGTSVIQDDSPSSGLPSIGQNANLLSPNPTALKTPVATLSAWIPPSSVATSAVSSVSIHPKDKDRVGGVAAKDRHQHLGEKLKKKWVWTNSIIQDGDTVPAGADHTTPAATLVAPTFPALSAPAEASSSALSSLPVTTSIPLSAPAEASSSSLSTIASQSLDEAAIFSALAAANRLALIDASFQAAQSSASVPAVKMVKREKRFREE